MSGVSRYVFPARCVHVGIHCFPQSFHHDPSVKHIENPAFKRVSYRPVSAHAAKLLLRLSVAESTVQHRDGSGDGADHGRSPPPSSPEYLTPWQRQALKLHTQVQRQLHLRPR